MLFLRAGPHRGPTRQTFGSGARVYPGWAELGDLHSPPRKLATAPPTT